MAELNSTSTIRVTVAVTRVLYFNKTEKHRIKTSSKLMV